MAETRAETESDMKATRDDLLADARRLEEIELEKAALEPDDPRVTELSREAEALARGMVPKTVAQTELSMEVAAQPAD
jgi:hypothetical protein